MLQLYVAAYQAPPVWKDVYKHFAGLLSAQIIKDVEAFVRSTPFSDAEVVQILASA